MINLIWFVLIAAGVIVAALKGRIDLVTSSAIAAAANAVEVSFSLIGIMCLWLGVMKIAEKAGLIKVVAFFQSPLIRFLFPGIPQNHPALGAIIMTISANLLGLGNAVTPLGIKAMEELQTLNKKKDTATPEMCTLLALCTTGLTLVPATVIALRAGAGSVDPAEIVGSTVLVSLLATMVVLIVDRICRKIFIK